MKKAATCLGLSWSTSATPSFGAGSTFSANQFHFEFIEPDGKPSVALPKLNRELPLQKNLQKKCISCTRTFTLSGSKKPQKYCPRCSRRGIARGRGLPTSNPLKPKGAETRFWTLIPPANWHLRSASPLPQAIGVAFGFQTETVGRARSFIGSSTLRTAQGRGRFVMACRSPRISRRTSSPSRGGVDPFDPV